MRKTLAIALLLPVVIVAIAGCSDGRKISTPPACLTAPEFWLTALADAPDKVMIEESASISECLPEKQTVANQEEVGRTAVIVASSLASSIKDQPGGKGQDTPTADQAALMAGYLVGALEKGANESGGIHDTLVTRVEAAATNGLDTAAPAVQKQYEAGREAGLSKG